MPRVVHPLERTLHRLRRHSIPLRDLLRIIFRAGARFHYLLAARTRPQASVSQLQCLIVAGLTKIIPCESRRQMVQYKV